jgi:protein SHQ1
MLFSYAYECRTTQHEPTPESAWTLASLIPACSALDPPNSSPLQPLTFSTEELTTTLVASYRRSLAFPLYRSWILAEACKMDAARLLCNGKRTVVRCLLEMKSIFDHHEIYYVYSKIWIDDFCVWAQAYAKYVCSSSFYTLRLTVNSDDVLVRLGKCVLTLEIEKSSASWDLEQLEAATQAGCDCDADSDDESEATSGSDD